MYPWFYSKTATWSWLWTEESSRTCYLNVIWKHFRVPLELWAFLWTRKQEDLCTNQRQRVLGSLNLLRCSLFRQTLYFLTWKVLDTRMPCPHVSSIRKIYVEELKMKAKVCKLWNVFVTTDPKLERNHRHFCLTFLYTKFSFLTVRLFNLPNANVLQGPIFWPKI